MRNINQLITSLVFAFIVTLVAAAGAAAQEAKIVKILGRGSATVTIAGQSLDAHESMAIPLAAVVTTTTQEVFIEVVPGIVSSVRNNSSARVDTLAGPQPELELLQGSLVTQIDKKRIAGKTYKVKTANGVAAARGTAFTVTLGANGFSVTATADAVQFTTPTGANVLVQAGTIFITTPGAAAPIQAVPLASVASNPEVAQILRDAVSTVSTVVANNLGSISAESATNVISQVVSVAVSALPSEAAAFTSQAVSAVTASGSATSATQDAAATAAGAVTAAAVKAAPDQAAQIAGAAASTAPGQAGVITAAAQQVAPQAKEAIAQQVAASTGQSTTSVQSNADASAGQASTAVKAANDATSNVVSPSPTPAPPAPSPQPVEEAPKTPTTPVDPTIGVSPSS